jgi:hypothetical protein
MRPTYARKAWPGQYTGTSWYQPTAARPMVGIFIVRFMIPTNDRTALKGLGRYTIEVQLMVPTGPPKRDRRSEPTRLPYVPLRYRRSVPGRSCRCRQVPTGTKRCRQVPTGLVGAGGCAARYPACRAAASVRKRQFWDIPKNMGRPCNVYALSMTSSREALQRGQIEEPLNLIRSKSSST